MGVSAPSSLASQTYFRERMRAKKGEGEEGKNTSGHYCQDFVSTWYVRNVISWPINASHMWIPDWSMRWKLSAPTSALDTL